MNTTKRLKNKREELALAVGLLFIAFLIGYAFYGITQNAENNKWVKHTNEVLRESEALISALKDAETGQRDYLLTEDKSYLSHYEQALHSVETLFSSLITLTADNPKQQQKLALIREKTTEKLSQLNEANQLIQASGFDAAREFTRTSRDQKLMEDLRKLTGDFQEEENQLLSQRETEALASTSTTLYMQGTGGFFVVLLLFFAILNVRKQKKNKQLLFQELDSKNREYVLNNGQPLREEKEVMGHLVGNLQHMKEFIRKIGDKDYTAELPGLTAGQHHLNKANMAGALLEVRNLLKQKDQEEGIRKWANEGVAKFSEIIRQQNHSLEDLADEVLQQLVKYLKANQGALYVLSSQEEKNGEEVMEMLACYAWNRKKYLHQKIAKGEGLAGQAWQEGEPIFLTDVPDSYVRISSGLGEANPNCVIIVPLKANEKVLGVVEIASFQAFEKHEIEFIEKIAESLASAVSSVRTNERTKQLLIQSQEQTEEMRAQEEEMRQNMEELEATQEEMRRQEVEMRGQLTAVNNTMASIEFDLKGHVITANENFQKVMGYKLEEIKGRHHRMFCEKVYADSEEYRQFWEQLNSGNAFSGEFKRITKSGREIWLRASYTPVVDHHGQVIKLIKYALEITEEKLESLDLQGKMEAINRSNAVIEFSPEGKILNANALFLELMKYQKEEIVGHHHHLFVSAEEKKSEAYAKHWERLRSGEYLQGEFDRVDKKGSTIWINGTYNPVFDPNGKVVKVVKIARDITKEKMLEAKMRQNIEEMETIQEELNRKFSENDKMKRDLNAY